ncbi:membrane protein A14 [Aotine betaherpesvirus 1]|uniref:Membrane protein A14 n=1 Tax=Aotine betaherpesvirus 1 TaxID=50290 RepID=G8XU89_9BETA|nr:membrane protein A14 [Aotine betaherpesvirus 1]AEV80720.1 membrane protein A14 [Aotine betaherpesvirus 1]
MSQLVILLLLGCYLHGSVRALPFVEYNCKVKLKCGHVQDTWYLERAFVYYRLLPPDPAKGETSGLTWYQVDDDHRQENATYSTIWVCRDRFKLAIGCDRTRVPTLHAFTFLLHCFAYPNGKFRASYTYIDSDLRVIPLHANVTHWVSLADGDARMKWYRQRRADMERECEALLKPVLTSSLQTYVTSDWVDDHKTMLKCAAFNVNPEEVNLAWWRDDADHIHDADVTTGFFANGSSWKLLTLMVPLGEEYRYTCRVQHGSWAPATLRLAGPHQVGDMISTRTVVQIACCIVIVILLRMFLKRVMPRWIARQKAKHR